MVYTGTLNTGGKLKIDNGAQVYGQSINQQVSNIAMTNMGQGYTGTPIAWGTAVVLDTSLAGNAGQIIIRGSFVTDGTHVYYCIDSAMAGLPSSPAWPYTGLPATDATTFSRGGGTFIYVDEIGAIGNPLKVGTSTALISGAQYFYNGNLYMATSTSAVATAPTHTSGLVGNLLYTGTRARVTVNYDAVAGRVRSLSLTNAGSGIANSSVNNAPVISISNGVKVPASAGTVPVTLATATSVFIQQFAGPANSKFERNATLTINGGLTINNDQSVPAQLLPI